MYKKCNKTKHFLIRYKYLLQYLYRLNFNSMNNNSCNVGPYEKSILYFSSNSNTYIVRLNLTIEILLKHANIQEMFLIYKYINYYPI